MAWFSQVIGASLVGLGLWWLISFIAQVTYNLYLHPLRRFPGPWLRAGFYLPDKLSILRGVAYKDIEHLHETYGPVVRITPSALSYNTAQAWKDIYGLKPDRTELAKDPIYFNEANRNILVVNQADHTRMRKTMAPGFSDTALVEQETLLSRYFYLLIEKLQERVDGPECGRVDLSAWFNFTTFDIIADMTVGEPFGALEAGQYHSYMTDVFASIKIISVLRLKDTYPILGPIFAVLLTLVPSFGAKLQHHREFTKAKVEDRLARKTDRKDFMTYILRKDSTPGAMTFPELMSTCRALLVAGSETTATLLTGASYLLLRHPHVLARLRSEIRTSFRSAEEITPHSLSSASRLPYLEAVLTESLRCYPPVPSTLPRITGPAGAVIDGKFVPAKTTVGVHQWSTYQSKQNFAFPDRFAPERWLANPPEEYLNDNRAALQPFSLGPRVCLGKSLAYLEMRSVLARLLWHFDIELDEESRGWMDTQKEFALWDKPPLWVTLKHTT
ncbi:putative benzoate 4-monooxygenase cytochrome P450 [Xylariales sp. PMI_506]|nr:putative benzoate 4-monooxygenase cytochrome P450 [Xylariales sp. PMI_506]